MKTIILNETEFGKICAEREDKRDNLTLHVEDYPERDCDIFIEFTIRWKVIDPPEYDKFSGLKSYKGRTRAEVIIYELKAFRNDEPEEVIYSEEALKEQIEYNLI